MLLAAIGDIHGNLPALSAVLEEIDEMGIQTILNTGDCVVGGRWPNEVIDLLKDRNIPTCQGKMDRTVVRFIRKRKTLIKKYSEEEFSALEWTYENTHSDNLEFLRALPKQARITIESIQMCLCHGSPSGQSITLEEGDDIEKYRRQREIDPADIIICGRTHRSFSRMVDNTLFVNPGSIGISLRDELIATYVQINTEEEPWTVEPRSVPYKIEGF